VIATGPAGVPVAVEALELNKLSDSVR
jgi:hypothetical protein